MDISIRELKANPARAIARVQLGERVRITSHRKVVAELVAPGSGPVTGLEPPRPISDEDAAAIARLMASGIVAEPATQALKLGPMIELSLGPDGQTMSDLVIALRGPG